MSQAKASEQQGQQPWRAIEPPVAEVPGPMVQTASFVERLNEADRGSLMARARGESYAARAVICREGDPGDALYIVEKGRVAVLKGIGGGRSALLGYRGQGEILGEMSLVGRQPRSASVVAVEDTELLRIDAADFATLIDEHPGIGWAVLNVLSDRLYVADVARTTIIQEEQALVRRVRRLTGEAERLAELARVRQETAALIVHDLRTPLAVIDGCLGMLRTSLSGEALEASDEILDLAERGCARLRTLIDDLLASARQEVSPVTLAWQPVDLARLLATAVESVEVTARGAGLRLSLEVPPDLPQPRGDTAQLERVMGNLLDNAVSYTPAGGSIAVAAAEGEGVVQVSVTDTGPGVPTEHREEIFEQFVRVAGVKGRRQGFGLGLYFCRQVVQAHGGRIWVEPGQDGVGSRFVFELPLEGEAAGD
jgi:signal transduction histidine kinase